MSTVPDNIEESLWNYIDGNINEEQRSLIEQLLRNNQEWKARYTELTEVHQLMLNHLELDEPSLRFTQNVMEDILKYQIAPATSTYINKNIIWGIGIFFFTLIAGLLIYGFGQINWGADTGSESPLASQLSRLDWSKFFNNTYMTVFMMINTVLALMLLDMYLAKKKKQVKSNL